MWLIITKETLGLHVTKLADMLSPTNASRWKPRGNHVIIWWPPCDNALDNWMSHH